MTHLVDPPLCRYCGKPAKLVPASEVYRKMPDGLLWHCVMCAAYCKADAKTHKPIGTLANRELRDLRKICNLHFEGLWRKGHTTKDVAYALLREWTGEKHIGYLDLRMCKQLLNGVKEFLNKKRFQSEKA